MLEQSIKTERKVEESSCDKHGHDFINSLDWSSPDISLRSDKLIAQTGSRPNFFYLLDIVDKNKAKFRIEPEQSWKGSYFSNASIIACSNWVRAKKYVSCGAPGQFGPSFCNMPRLCDACSKRYAARMYVKYKHSFYKAQYWYHLTYSFKSNVNLNDCDTTAYIGRWKQANDYVAQLKAQGYIKGAVTGHELTINSLINLTAFPHTHTVFNTDSDLIEDGIINPAFTDNLPEGVSVSLKRIETEDAFIIAIKYPFKTINLNKIYSQEKWGFELAQLNKCLDTFLNKITEFEFGYSKTRYCGNMSGTAKGYIGNPEYTSKSSKKRQQLQEKRALAKIEQIEDTETVAVESVPDSMSNPIITHLVKAARLTQVAPGVTVNTPEKKQNNWLAPALTVGGLGLGGAALYNFLKNKNTGTAPVADVAPKADVPFKYLGKMGLPPSEPLIGPNSPSGLSSTAIGDTAGNALIGGYLNGKNPGNAINDAVYKGLPHNAKLHSMIQNLGEAEKRYIGGVPASGDYNTSDKINDYLSTITDGAGTAWDIKNPATRIGADVVANPFTGSMALQGMFKKAPKSLATKALGGATPILGTAYGANAGYEIGNNPLMIEAYAKHFPNAAGEIDDQSYARARNVLTKGLGGLGGILGAAQSRPNPAGMVAGLGTMGLGLGNEILNARQAGLQEQAANLGLSDVNMSIADRLHAGMKSPNPQEAQAAAKAMKAFIARTMPNTEAFSKMYQNDPVLARLLANINRQNNWSQH